MNKPSIRERVVQARVYLTQARILLQAAEHDAGTGHAWQAIVETLTATRDAEHKSRHALDTLHADEPPTPFEPEEAA